MDNIRLPEDFTDRVMQKIEQRERAAARRTRIITVSGSILGGIFLIAASAILLRHFNTGLNLPTGEDIRTGILGSVSDFMSKLSYTMREAITALANPLLCIVLAVFILACAGLWHDHHRYRQDLTTSTK